MAALESKSWNTGSVTVSVEPFAETSCFPINQGLSSFNASALGSFDHTPLVVVARSEDGSPIGGVIADLFLEWLNIQVVWVSETFRGTGIGSALMARMEAEAAALGAERAYVDTVEFQAPWFYSRLGYVEFGRLRNFVQGHDRIFYEKVLLGSRLEDAA